MDDEVKIEYFAVSLPDLQIFEEDLQKRNRIHCLFMMVLGHLGKGEREEADTLLRRLQELEPEHQGVKAHISSFLKK
jgi:hypothetical protein